MTEPGPTERPTANEEREPISGAIARPAAPGHPTEVAGRYRILGRIGDGGMGVVYKAEHVLSKKKLAIKLLHPHLSHGKQAVERFRREVSAAAEIDHPGIVQVFDAGMDADGSFYMAMELLEGHSLASEMKTNWPGTRRSLELILELCEPLARAHKKGFIHRDLKPDNVFLARDAETGAERLKLLDFGLAREITKKGTTESGVTFGTPEYMAPEQSMSAKSAGTAADVWSVGVMLYELLSGFHPFTGDTPNAIMVAAIKDAHEPLETRAPHVPRAICEAVEKALVKNVSHRVATAGELADLLHQAIDGSSPLDDRKPAKTHRMSEMLAGEGDDGAPDMTGIPAADDAAIARGRRLAQRQIPTEAYVEPPQGTRSKWTYAIVAGVVSVLAVIVLGLWSSRRTTPEMSVVPLATTAPAPPVTAAVEIPGVIVEEIAPPPSQVMGLEPPPETVVEEAPAETPRVRTPSVALTTLSAEDTSRARECLAHNDFGCAIAVYRTSRDPHDLRRVIDALDHLGRHREALGAMRDFVRRFPRASETSTYRAQLAAAGM
jgi:serine/threonine-protein kinase